MTCALVKAGSGQLVAMACGDSVREVPCLVVR
jgi:hypothetical protein